MRLIKLFVLLAVISVSCNKKVEEKNNKKPNVVLVITDDQGYGDLGIHGNKIIKTPNIDAFHGESYHLTDFHVGPTCAPTRSGLMTGRYANSVGVWHTVGGWSLLREQEKTMADMFTQAGYKTGAFGKWHLGDNYPFRAHDRGFQEAVMHYGGGAYQTPDYWGNTYFNDTYFKNGEPTKYEGFCTDVFFDEAKSFIKKNKDEPFFCYISTNAPHGPYNVPLEYYNMYKDIDENLLSDTQKRFYGMITNVDDNFGELRKTLKELNIADNTILIFMTDNGTAAGYRYNKQKKITTGFNAGMRGAKGSAYEGGHRVPFFIHWKDGDITVSKDITQLTANLDIMPTLAELCGIELPKDGMPIAGKSLVPMFKNPELKDDRMLVTDSQRLQKLVKWRNSSVMQNKWRLINGKELYNIENDKGQKKNLAESNPEKVKEMRDFYEKWFEEVSVQGDEEVYIPIGTKFENPTTLTSHDLHSMKEKEFYAWNQIYIRNGAVAEGYWSINVTEPGEYEFSLRRYPIESGLKINATTPKITPEDVPGLEKTIPEGKNLDFAKAAISIQGIDKDVKFEENAKSVEFTLNLQKGNTKLEASFFNKKGEKNTAYYVYVTKK
ncbi:Arylsulfatase A [Lutibacter oricola]|uniref:Arylsulfatase A n=1 Tax=Lutibacter oricola TaxID=762486 RepID=A0A1H2ZLK8_9FLAO|nr:arylsulfatase [Lutibacter oricola]SDX18253.1 Arylsulfatase A [Lutibacter oricola]